MASGKYEQERSKGAGDGEIFRGWHLPRISTSSAIVGCTVETAESLEEQHQPEVILLLKASLAGGKFSASCP
jgi:hypothetical protein